MPDFTFKKEERLKSTKVLSRLFSEGSSFGVFPLRVVWMPAVLYQTAYPVQMALSVPKKKFNKAAHRNVLRRRIREAYRLNKHEFYAKLSNCKGQYAFMIIYVAKEPLPYMKIEKALQVILKRMAEKLVKRDATIAE